MKENEDDFDDFPDILESIIEMDEPNLPIKIYQGKFSLQNDKNLFEFNGKIQFHWFPHLVPQFTGISKKILLNSLWLKRELKFDLIFNDQYFRNVLVTKYHYSSEKRESHVEGIVGGRPTIGDKTISVEKIQFVIPNLLSLFGSIVKKKNNGNGNSTRNRLQLINDQYDIILDKRIDFNDLYDSLKAKGGYISLYNGELKKRDNKPISFDENDKITECLSYFLSFVNGRRTAPIFSQGMYQNDIKWIDYSHEAMDPYKTVHSWSPQFSINGISQIWTRFSDLWKDETDKNSLILLIHWYCESNSSSGATEGSIIMAQTALELIYNWWIVEKRKMIIGKDAENINASNKIRLLLSQMDISTSIPSSLGYLNDFLEVTKSTDALDLIVQIRNAIVHSQEEKRKKLFGISQRVKYETLQLCLWYIELLLLFILGYDDEYYNRCSNRDEVLPWSKTNQSDNG